MKIGIDARSLLGTPTGVGRYLSNLLRQFRQIDRANTYWLYFDRDLATPLIPQANFHQKTLTLPAVQNYFTWNHLRLPPELLRHPVDLVHFPFYTIPLIRNYPCLVTIHDITYEIHPEWYSWKGLLATRIFSRYAARHADLVLTDSESTKRDMMQHYRIPEAKIRVIPLGVEERFCPIDDRERIAPIKARYRLTAAQIVVYIGSIHTRRNVAQLVQAFQQVQQRLPDTQLLIVGKQEYPYIDLAALIAELGLTAQVLLSGYAADDDLPLLYNLADVFMYPSSYEGFGLPVLEAMACGTPVITGNTSSLPEVAGDAAILINPSHVAEMADALLQLLNNQRLRQEFRQRGLLRARQFSWQQTAEQTLAAYQDFRD